MKAICLHGPTVERRDVPKPVPAPNEVLVRVHAAGVTPTELQWYPTTHTKEGTARSLPVLGHEFSGVIEAIGADASGFFVGQEVYGMNDWYAEGTTADYCVTTPSAIAAKPARLTHVEAASAPIGALTACQGLLRAKLGVGDRVLVHGGAGAVGVYAIQIARLAGAQVFTTASARNADFLSHLGADHVIDYKNERFEEKLSPLDVIFDAVGGETLQRSWKLLKPGGRMVTIAADVESTQDARAKEAFFIVEPNAGQLAEIAHLLNQGKLKPFVDGVVPFDQAPSAYTGAFQPRAGRGKLVVAVAESGQT